MHTSEFIQRINDHNLYGITTLIRIQHLQNYLWSSQPVWNKEVISRFSGTPKNLSDSIIKCLVEHDINLTSNLSRQIPNIPTNGGKCPIEFEYKLGNKNWYNHNKKYMRRQGILYLEQLLDAN